MMTEKHVAEINELWNDHGEALMAFGADCAHAYGKGMVQGMMKGAIEGVAVSAVIVALGTVVYQKIKDRKKK